MSQCVISEQSLSAGMFTAHIAGNMLATLPWAFEDVITLKLDGVVKFKGVVLSPKRVGGGLNENILLRFADPWWYMGQGTYVQPWWVAASGTPYDAPRVALFAGITPGEGWVKRTIGEDIADIITQCNAYHGGSVMQLGDLLGDGFEAMPIPQRVNNVTYDSVLRQVLAWVPDAIQQWDYTTTPPTLSFVQRAAATVRSYSMTDNAVMVEQEFLKHDELVVRGVEITYAGLDAFGFVTKVIDQAGATTGTRLLKTVIDCTGNANGAAATSPTSTPAVTRNYTVVSEAIAMTPEWWFKYGDTGAQSAADIAVDGTSNVAFAPAAPENAGKDDLGGCGLQWLEGGMPRSRLSANTRVALVTGNLTIRTTKAEESGAAPISTTEVQERRVVRMLVPVTKLSGDYEQVISEASSSIGNGIPQLLSPIFLTPGMAAALLAAWGVAQYDGVIKLVKSECDEAIALGDVINVTGGLTEWTTMDTQVHSLTREIDTGTTTIQTGVAEHLGVEEYANLLRMSRLRTVPAMDLDQQAMGQVPSNEPDPDELDDLVGPGGVKYSVLNGPQKIKHITATGTHTSDMTAEAGPTTTNKNTASGDEVVTTPGKQTVQNTTAEKSNTGTPDKQSLKSGESDSAELSVVDGLKLLTETETAQLKPGILTITGESGFSITLSAADGLLMTVDGLTVQLKPDTGLVISDGTGTTTLNLLQLLHDNGSGKTMSVTDEQVVISATGKTSVSTVDDLTLTATGGTLGLSIAGGLENTADGNTLTASGTGGIYHSGGGGATAALSKSAGLQLDDGASGTVNVATQTGEAISFQATEGCDVDEGGEPITTTAKVLRGAVTEA
ncbi:MAG: hypothetical protein K9N47_05495 [Prosthecobacter sp.]|uniref:hypothetical protein n=1 Tax=Prosthecobacter sp. TaxID=1965333 RepID=UPI0025FFD3DE|nr:hypothetical protein [Prosthecobacter sp.]MCF7785554.1 hypothetical protein [Prosthecobacter sp.]